MIGDILTDLLHEFGIERSAPQIGATDYEMSQIRSLLNAAGRDIATRAEWSGAMRTVPLSAGTSTPLPADFQEMAEAGAVAIDGYTFPARVVVDPTMWQLLIRYPSAQHYCHLSGGSIHVTPEIDGGTLRYVSRYWLAGNKSAVTVNADDPIFPDDLLMRGTVWRWRRQKGLPFEDQLAEFEADLSAAIRADRGQ